MRQGETYTNDMAVSSLVSVEEYLGSSYDPDCDYLEGVIEERNVGEVNHGDAQGRVYAFILMNLRQFWTAPEIRVRVKPNRYRVPDVTIIRGSKPKEPVITTPPIVVAEVLSPEDRAYRLQQRIDDYLNFGVSAVWVLDPQDKRAFIHTVDGAKEVKDGYLRTPADSELVVPLSAVFVD
jgi:Uma2 family endonuclease